MALSCAVGACVMTPSTSNCRFSAEAGHWPLGSSMRECWPWVRPFRTVFYRIRLERGPTFIPFFSKNKFKQPLFSNHNPCMHAHTQTEGDTRQSKNSDKAATAPSSQVALQNGEEIPTMLADRPVMPTDTNKYLRIHAHKSTYLYIHTTFNVLTQ